MLSEVPEGWNRKPLGDLLSEAYGGGTPSKSEPAYWGGDIFWASVKDMTDFNPLCTKDSITRAGLDNSSSKMVPAGELVFCTRMAVGSARRYQVDVAINQDLRALIPLDSLVREYLYYWVSSKRSQFEDESTGTTVKGLRKERLLATELLLPPLNEQHRIAEILSSVDASIQTTQAVIEQAERVKRGLMEELLTGGLGSEAIERGEVPEGWNVKALSDVAVVKGGKRMPKGAKFSEKPTAYPYIRVSDFANGSISTKDIQYVSPEHQAQIARYTISKEDIYISIAGTLGVVGTVPDELDGAQLTENAAKISIQSASMIDREFLARVLQSSVGQSQIGIKKGVGGGVPKLALFRIGEINLPMPPLQEQKRISEVLSSIDDFIAAQNSIVEQNQRAKRGLMSDLLTGKVRTV